MHIEEERGRREKEEKERREKTGLIGKGIKPPIFRGVEGERPEAHLMRAKDWLEASNPLMTEELKIQNFRLTLDHNVREWYDKTYCKDTWENMRTQFSQYFSTQGKSIFNLQKRWNSFTFNEETDDIEVFLRDVQETPKQLKYTDDLVWTMIKTHIPRRNGPGSHANGSTYCTSSEQSFKDSYDGTHERCHAADAGCDSWRQPLLHGNVRDP